MSRRRRRRSVELVKTSCITSHLLVYTKVFIWKTFAVPSKSASSSTTMAAQRPICISHLLSWVSHKCSQRLHVKRGTWNGMERGMEHGMERGMEHGMERGTWNGCKMS